MTNNNILLAGLYLVATPIGNLGDFSSRAVETLKDVDVIACEDTRTSNKLLSHYGIKKKLISYHDHNSQTMIPKIIAMIRDGLKVALISDAGAPLISDPGYKLVGSCRNEGLYVTSIPGAVALITALQLSELSSQSFSFKGFLPHKASARKDMLSRLAGQPDTVIFYESPNRLLDTLADVHKELGDIRICVARELTKKFEEVTTGRVLEVSGHYQAKEAVKGEIVLLLEIPEVRQEMTDEDIVRQLRQLMQDMTKKESIAAVAEKYAISKKKVYDLAIAL